MARLKIVIVLILVVCLGNSCKRLSTGGGDHLTVAAPDYLKGILDKGAEQFRDENGTKVVINYQPFDSLISNTATTSGYDLIIGIDHATGDSLSKSGFFDSIGYSCPFRLSLVVAQRAGGDSIHEMADLAGPDFKRIVMLDPQIAYEGILAQEMIGHKRLWQRVREKVIYAKSVEHMVSFCNSGEADVAIALESSLDAAKGMAVVLRFDDELPDNLVQCGAVLASSTNKPVAHAFLDLFDARLCAIYKLRGVYLNGGEGKKQRRR